MAATGSEAVTLEQFKMLMDSGAGGKKYKITKSRHMPEYVKAEASPGEVVVTSVLGASSNQYEGGQHMTATGKEVVTIKQLKMWLDSRVPPVEIVSWADGTDEEVAAMVAAADAGKLNLSDYWHEGDERTVHLSYMPAAGDVSDSHAAQDVVMVLTDPGHYTLSNGKKCSFVVLQKDCLKETGDMNSWSTNSGGWNDCLRRTWCNSVYRNAIPASLRGIFKQFKVRTANGSGSGVTESTDWFSLFSEKEIFGSTTYANSSAESKNTQLNWFKTSSNRIKKWNGVSSHWWERSPDSVNSYSFCFASRNGYADWTNADASYGLAPFGCI